MKRGTLVHIALIGMLVATAATTEAARWIVPAAAHASGSQGTNWRTDLRLVNSTEATITVRIYLLRAGENNSLLDESTEHTVAAHGQFVIQDVLAEDFSYLGTAGLLVDCDETELVVTSRTYNLLGLGNVLDLPEGSTFGQFIPGIPASEAFGAGQEGHIIYLAQSEDFRSNLGFAATTSTGGQVTIELYSDDGVLLGSVERSFAGFEQYQINRIFDAVGAADSTSVRAVVRATAPIVSYASVVDEGTGDPVAVMAQRVSEATAELALAAAARSPGAENSLWRTDMRLYNPNSSVATVTLVYHPKGQTQSSGNSKVVSIGRGAILALDDVMLSEFGLFVANGGMRISSDVGIIVWSRTYNQTADGTFGQSIPAVALGFPLVEGRARIYTGLSDVDFRSNVGFFNLSSNALDLDLALMDSNGTIVAEGDYGLGGSEMNQVDVFDYLGVSKVAGGVYSLSIMGEGDVASYVSIIDRNSGDPVFESGAERAAESGGGGGGGGGGDDCINLTLIEAGRVATWDLSGIADGSAFTGEVESTFVSVSETGATTDTVSETSAAGFQVTVNSRTVQTYTILDDPLGYLAIEKIETHAETTAGGFVSTIDTTLTNSPPQLIGPGMRWCEGETWSTPVVTQTIEATGMPTTSGPSPTHNGIVESINEVMTTPAGTFTTVKSRRTGMSGDEAGYVTIAWIDVATSMMVRQEGRDPAGNLIFEYVLIDLD